MSFTLNAKAFQHGLLKNKLVIVINHHNAPGTIHCGYESRLLSESNEEVGCGSSRNQWIDGDNTKAFFLAATEALRAVPVGSNVDLVCTLDYAIEELSRTADQRRASDYRKTDGSLLEDHAAYKLIDELVEAKKITLTARRPSGYDEHCRMKALKSELRGHPKVGPFGVAS
ncbi:hypothetical protein [Rhizobium lentis]|uniref:hypothetical protein n=1 Tax=Rhizobium lentis TaxID=1138194 RepID=UPI001C83C8F6|nr:hypothetical protein [Rhizobium lentis]MBX5145385.1 hypothetical protein [Rhizobium lentis]